MKNFLKFIIPLFGSKIHNSIFYSYIHHKFSIKPPKILWEKPVRFNHKIIWLKRNYRVPNAERFVDKILVKNYVKEIISKEIIIPTLGIWEDANKIAFSEFKEPYILKTNHGSGMNLIIDNYRNIKKKETIKLLNKWLSVDYSYISGEYQYKKIKRKIFAEPLIADEEGNPLKDFKFFCFKGKAKFIQVDFDRHFSHKRNFYDLNWNKLNFNYLFPSSKFDEPIPNQLKKMIDISEELSKNFNFIRVDLYQTSNKIYFGELTFHPGGGFEPIQPDEWDFRLGKYLDI